MSIATSKNSDAQQEHFADAAQRAAHFAHEARLIKSMAADAVEDGVYATKRAVKGMKRSIDDLKDETAHYVKRQPFKAVGIAAAVGLVTGAIIGWIGVRFGQRQCNRID